MRVELVKLASKKKRPSIGYGKNAVATANPNVLSDSGESGGESDGESDSNRQASHDEEDKEGVESDDDAAKNHGVHEGEEKDEDGDGGDEEEEVPAKSRSLKRKRGEDEGGRLNGGTPERRIALL